MSKKNRTAITPTRNENYPEWYQAIIKASDLAEHSSVRGCMVIKPWGYGIWEKIVADLDKRFKVLGVENAYFPLFIPLSLMQKEAAHVEGFATECAVVTHHRLEKDANGVLVAGGELEEPLVVRPTSEMVIGEAFARWISSYRDLPLKINQWANVVRWEMRPRLFLRTAEFLWQEGHTAHVSAREALSMAREILFLYRKFGKEILAIPFYTGEKSEGERFPGAEKTFTIEALMQDGKALQGGTSHYMGQNFAKASGIKYTGQDGGMVHAYTTSWGVTTRLIGAMIMVHSDDNGLVLPPPVAPKHVVIIPFLMQEDTRERVLAQCHALAKKLEQVSYRSTPVRVLVDETDKRAGDKAWHWIKRGVPLRIEIGSKEVERGVVVLGQRHREKHETVEIGEEELIASLSTLLETMHDTLYERAQAFRDQHTETAHSLKEFECIAAAETFPEKLIRCPWGGGLSLERELQQKYGVTIRCIFDEKVPSGFSCPFSGATEVSYALFGKSY